MNSNHVTLTDQTRLVSTSLPDVDEFCMPSLGSSPPRKKRKKNNQCNLLLFKDFSHRCHLLNNISPTAYRAAKYNIKNLCPLHDMLPVISDMEQEPFKHSNESHFNGVRYTLRNGYLQTQCVPNNTAINHPSMNNVITHTHSDMNNIKNLSLWVCTGIKPQCIQFKQKLLHRSVGDCEDHKSQNGVIEIPLNLNNVLIPFMNSLSTGSQNTNLYFNVNINVNMRSNEEKKLRLRFLPLDSLTIQSQINTKRVSFKVLSCGTFKRNLQPMPDACRITKLMDGQYCFTSIDDEHHIGLKIMSRKVFDRKKVQGSDSILGTGFDCSSRCSWRKPRIYWVSKTIGYVRDPLKSPNKLQKTVISNQDIRISLLWPKHISGNVDFYLGGILSSYIEHINISKYTTPISMESSLTTNNRMRMPSPNQTPNETPNQTPSDDDTKNVLQAPPPPPPLQMNFTHNITRMQRQANPNTFIIHNNTNNRGALGASASIIDPESFSILSDIEKDLITGTLNHSTSMNKLNVQTPYVLDALSQLLMFCIKHQNANRCNPIDAHCHYYVAILNHIANSLNPQCAVDGFIKCWIDIDAENTNKNEKENLCSFMHLVTRYNRIHLMQHTIALFREHHKEMVNAFVDIRTTLYNESSLIIGIKYGYQQLIEYMLNGIWSANGIHSAIIMNNIINSPYDDCGECGITILAALISFKLFSVLQYLFNINSESPTKFLSQHDVIVMNESLKISTHSNNIQYQRPVFMIQ